MDRLCRQLKKDVGARVTVIAGDGKVIGDSDTDSALMDNHLHRTEIEQALLFETGMAIRYSDTLKYDLLYVAKKISLAESTKGFIRLAVPLKEVDHAINLLRVKITLGVLIVLLATSLVSLWQTEHLRRLLRQITDFSKSLSLGDIDKRLYLRNAGEFSEIAENLTSMSVKLQAMIARNEEERRPSECNSEEHSGCPSDHRCKGQHFTVKLVSKRILWRCPDDRDAVYRGSKKS